MGGGKLGLHINPLRLLEWRRGLGEFVYSET